MLIKKMPLQLTAPTTNGSKLHMINDPGLAFVVLMTLENTLEHFLSHVERKVRKPLFIALIQLDLNGICK